MDAGVIVPHLAPNKVLRNIELGEIAYKWWGEKSGTRAVRNPSTMKQLVVDERSKAFSSFKDVLPGAILCRFVALLGSVDDQLEEVWVFRHPEHGIGQVSVAKTVAHETLLEDWWKLLHTRDRDFNTSYEKIIQNFIEYIYQMF